jgi:ubiquinone/menaquinone biosynthesis C-methylase UbiE
MEADEKRQRAASFGSVADAYAAYRPGYPHEAVAWLVGTTPGRVLELGAGTGKLTAGLLELGHDVIATDLSGQMLRHVTSVAPTARRLVARAEAIPLRSSSVDVVVAGQAFHWFDQERALPEIARVLRPGGVLGMTWNVCDYKVPWVKRLFAMIGQTEGRDDEDPVAGSDLFSTSDHQVFRHWQEHDRESLIGLMASQSRTATLSETERAELLAKVGELYDSYGRGPDGMLLPWYTFGFRARVAGLASTPPPMDDDGDDLFIDFH